jgi:hypothetical protein
MRYFLCLLAALSASGCGVERYAEIKSDTQWTATVTSTYRDIRSGFNDGRFFVPPAPGWDIQLIRLHPGTAKIRLISDSQNLLGPTRATPWAEATTPYPVPALNETLYVVQFHVDSDQLK